MCNSSDPKAKFSFHAFIINNKVLLFPPPPPTHTHTHTLHPRRRRREKKMKDKIDWILFYFNERDRDRDRGRHRHRDREGGKKKNTEDDMIEMMRKRCLKLTLTQTWKRAGPMLRSRWFLASLRARPSRHSASSRQFTKAPMPVKTAIAWARPTPEFFITPSPRPAKCGKCWSRASG